MAAGSEGVAVFRRGDGFAPRRPGNAAARGARIWRRGEFAGDGYEKNSGEPAGIYPATADYGARQAAQESADEDGGRSAARARTFNQRGRLLAETAAVGAACVSPFSRKCLFAGDGELR